MAYRPAGRSNRSGRAHADNDVFEGLPVKQWGHSIVHISLADAKKELETPENDKWADPPMPRDSHLLNPWTQHLLRIARSGKVGTKRKAESDSMDEDRPEDELADEAKANLEDRGYVAKKWRPVPESQLEPEHKHFEFLAKRRKGLPSLYAPAAQTGAPVPMRKTKVQKAVADGEVAVYEVLVPEGQTVDGEITETTELADVQPVVAVPGTVIEGVGIANEEGIVVAEHLKPPVAPRRNRPPPKKKGGPGRGKKRVTFTNADGTTYTTVVPNATKIVPQPGQTVKHVAKGEEAMADISEAQVAPVTTTQPTQGEAEGEEGEEGEDGEVSDEGDDEGDEDDEREEGELSEEDAPDASATPVPQEKREDVEKIANGEAAMKTEDVVMQDAALPPPPTSEPAEPVAEKPSARDASSSPELPLAKSSHSRQSSLMTAPATSAEEQTVIPCENPSDATVDGQPSTADDIAAGGPDSGVQNFEDGDEDLLGNLERSLGDLARQPLEFSLPAFERIGTNLDCTVVETDPCTGRYNTLRDFNEKKIARLGKMVKEPGESHGEEYNQR